jgi:hypothetical protein
MCTNYCKVTYYFKSATVTACILTQILPGKCNILLQGLKVNSVCGGCAQSSIWDMNYFFQFFGEYKTISLAWLHVVSSRMWPAGPCCYRLWQKICVHICIDTRQCYVGVETRTTLHRVYQRTQERKYCGRIEDNKTTWREHMEID